jgi:hypothetical protein
MTGLLAATVDSLPPADDRLYGPYAYGAGWLAAGVVAVLVAVALVAWALRPAARPTAAAVEAAPLRDRYLRHLDDLEGELAANRLDSRAVHHDLSRTLRRFAADVGTSGAPAMSAGDLDEAGQPAVAQAVKHYERPQFAAVADGDPRAAIDLARSVIDERSDAP